MMKSAQKYVLGCLTLYDVFSVKWLKFVGVEVVLSGETVLGSDNLLTTLQSFGETYFVSFGLSITKHTPEWRNVIHLSRGSENSEYGDRVPAVYITPDNKLEISSGVNGNKAFGFQSGQLVVNQWYQIQIEQVLSDGKVILILL